jgi:hypothetical protein
MTKAEREKFLDESPQAHAVNPADIEVRGWIADCDGWRHQDIFIINAINLTRREHHEENESLKRRVAALEAEIERIKVQR